MIEGIMQQLITFSLISLIWTIPLKGFSLWYSARNSQVAWFIVLLLVNTLGILEVIYLVFFREPKKAEKKSRKRRTSKRR